MVNDAQDDEGPLLRYLGTARGPLGEPLYDVHNALRLCRSRGRVKVCACVKLRTLAPAALLASGSPSCRYRLHTLCLPSEEMQRVPCGAADAVVALCLKSFSLELWFLSLLLKCSVVLE